MLQVLRSDGPGSSPSEDGNATSGIKPEQGQREGMSKLHKDIARACPLVYTFGRMEDPVQ